MIIKPSNTVPVLLITRLHTTLKSQINEKLKSLSFIKDSSFKVTLYTSYTDYQLYRSKDVSYNPIIMIADPPILKQLYFDQLDRKRKGVSYCSDMNRFNDDELLGSYFKMSSEEFKDLINATQWVQSTYAGVDSLFERPFSKDGESALEGSKHLVEYMRERNPDVVLSKLSGFFGKHMLEYVMYYMVDFLRNLSHFVEMQGKKEWMDSSDYGYKLMSDCTVAVMGYGDIGEYVCKRLKEAFGCKIIVLRNRKKSEDCEYVDTFYSMEKLGREGSVREFLSEEFDFLINTLPSTKDTKGLLNKSSLSSMKKDTNTKRCFINVGRGSIIENEEEDLKWMLDEGLFQRVVLDVFKKEPLSEKSTLWDYPKEKVVITPHISAMSQSSDVSDLFVENLEMYIKAVKNNEKIRVKHQVDTEKGY